MKNSFKLLVIWCSDGGSFISSHFPKPCISVSSSAVINMYVCIYVYSASLNQHIQKSCLSCKRKVTSNLSDELIFIVNLHIEQRI